MRGAVTEYVDQSASALRISIFEGALDEGQFCVFQTCCIGLGDLLVKAKIIGASHFLTFELGDQTLHEVFACTEVQADSKRAFCGPLGDVSGRLGLQISGISYAFLPRLETLERGARELEQLERLISRVSPEENCVGITQEFPNPDILTLTPKTAVLVKLGDGDEDDICVDTAHSYPNEETVVFTTTRITRR